MLVEAICILMILATITFIFLRSHRKDYAIASAPLLIVPFFHTLTYLIGDIFQITISSDIRAAADVLGLAIAVASMGILCVQLKSRKSKYAYLLVSGGFTTLLTMIFLFNIYLKV